MYMTKPQTGLTAKKVQEAQMKKVKKYTAMITEFCVHPARGYVPVNGALMPF